MPGLLWLLAFYRLDRYEPEPAGLLARTFFLGALSLGPVLGIEILGIQILTGPGGVAAVQQLPLTSRLPLLFLVIAPVEELAKFFAAWLSVGSDPEYNEPMDGVIYMAASALGFSTAENLYYVASLPPAALATRGVFSCFLHASTSGLVGFWWSEHRFVGRSQWVIAGALLAATLAHGVFDLIAFSQYRFPFFAMAVFLTILDLILMARIAQALEQSPFRPPEEGGPVRGAASEGAEAGAPGDPRDP